MYTATLTMWAALFLRCSKAKKHKQDSDCSTATIVDNQHVTAFMIFQAVLVNMAMYGRVAVCGAITGFHNCLQ